MPHLTWIECSLDDVALGASLCGFDMEIEAQIALDEEFQERLAAPRCERCLEETDAKLSLCGGEALCDGCLDAEVPEVPDDPDPFWGLL